jgi:hypothetical protein
MDTDLTPDQEAEARRIFEALKRSTEADLLALARLLASKPDSEIFGATEFAVRDRVHLIGAKAIEATLAGRKKGGTRAPAGPAPAAGGRPSSSAGKPAES